MCQILQGSTVPPVCHLPNFTMTVYFLAVYFFKKTVSLKENDSKGITIRQNVDRNMHIVSHNMAQHGFSAQ